MKLARSSDRTFFLRIKKAELSNEAALGLDVQTNAKGGKFMSIENSRQGALVYKADVEVLWEPGNFQDDGAKRVGVRFARNTDLEWTDGVEQAVIDDMIIFQKPFPGVTRTELESQLHSAPSR